jgi:hypothetical protein
MDPMRQGQQNRRGRGRNNHNNNNNNNNNQHRKGGQNPLSRSYESTGPDTKIRGTPAHIAEKYMQLARDALSSGDPVLAENYLQHAEHYNRIIMTYREQQVQNGEVGQPHGQIGRFRPAGMSDEEFAEEEGSEDFGSRPQPQMPRQGEQQPRVEGGGARYDDRPVRHEQRSPQPGRDRGERGFNDRGERPERSERFDRPERADRGDRPDRPERDRGERQDRPERAERRDAPDRGGERPERAAQLSEAAGDAPPRRRERAERAPMPTHEQPEFLRRPVRRPRREAASEEEGEEPSPAAVVDSD